jgi:hypothetical protein
VMSKWITKRPTNVVTHTLTWRCVDCHRELWLSESDNLEELRRAARRHA